MRTGPDDLAAASGLKPLRPISFRPTDHPRRPSSTTPSHPL